ncbi:MAG: hypothetical protein ACRC6V_02120 [Bacteroidales bacterium]
MFTQTSFSNPTFIRRIRRALWLAKLQSLKTGKRSTQYVVNRKGNSVLRLDVQGVTLQAAYASGCSSKDFSAMINKALQA